MKVFVCCYLCCWPGGGEEGRGGKRREAGRDDGWRGFCRRAYRRASGLVMSSSGGIEGCVRFPLGRCYLHQRAYRYYFHGEREGRGRRWRIELRS